MQNATCKMLDAKYIIHARCKMPHAQYIMYKKKKYIAACWIQDVRHSTLDT